MGSDYKVKDISLADFGRREVTIAEGEMPGLMKPLVDAGLAAAVVTPVGEEELSGLIRWAHEHGVSLVPRGASTSGYGGVFGFGTSTVSDTP